MPIDSWGDRAGGEMRLQSYGQGEHAGKVAVVRKHQTSHPLGPLARWSLALA
jgi:hypothetical protein